MSTDKPSDRVSAHPRVCDVKPDELIELNADSGLYLKPITKVNITVRLPTLRIPGQCITTWEVMEKLKKKSRPYKFKTLKVTKSNLEFIRLEGELDTKRDMMKLLARLEGVQLKLTGFAESLQVKAAEKKIGAKRHEWESYFRDLSSNKGNEMKPGCRPDTIVINKLPSKWFGGEKPKSDVLIQVFGTFGDIRRIHVPVLDTLPIDAALEDGGTGFKKFKFDDSLDFGCYIMYRDYVSFVRAMDALRGMKLVKKLEVSHNKYLEYDIEVEYDKTQHLSDKNVKRRRLNKEYGLQSMDEMRALRKETRRRRKMFENRVKELNVQKETIKTVFQKLIDNLVVEEDERLKREQQLANEARLKQRLTEEENNLRAKLLSKRSEMIRKRISNSNSAPLKSVVGGASSNLVRTRDTKLHKSGCRLARTRSVVVKSEQATAMNFMRRDAIHKFRDNY